MYNPTATPKAGKTEAYDFVMGFIATSNVLKDQYVGMWEEILANFMVKADFDVDGGQTTPYRVNPVYHPRRRQIVLKDPETHKLVMTFLAKIMRSVFGDPRREYVKAEPRGWEDAPGKAPTATRLLRYAFGLPGIYRSFQEASLEALLVGTSIVEVGYRYEEKLMPARSVSRDGYGFESFFQEVLPITTYDDIEIRPVAVTDFFPDSGRTRIDEMCGAAKRFRMTGYAALQMVEKGLYDKAAVSAAIEGATSSKSEGDARNYRRGLDLPTDEPLSPKFKEMIGYEYWGELPYDSGTRRMVVTILNGQTVREEPYPLADPHLPFHAIIINPVVGRFYGICPAEIVRYDQSFADALKVLMAEAIVRMVHPPIAFDPDSDLDVSALKAWKTDALIGVRGGPNSIGTLRYDANIQGAMAILGSLKTEIQDSSGARAGVQGDPGPNREAATAASYRINAAMDQPELLSRLIEEECLPPIGLAILRRYQQFLGGTEDLKNRVGELPEPVWIGDIMGEFDVTFTGSRTAMTRQQKLQGFQTLMAMGGAVPQFLAQIPWDQVGKALIGDVLELPEVAAAVGQAPVLAQNMALGQMLGQGTPAQTPRQNEPLGILPAQATGTSPG